MIKQQSYGQQWGPPIGLCLTLFVVAYSVGVVPAIMPRIVRELDSSIGYVQAALILVALVKASFTPTSENLIKRYGRKRVYLTGLGLFTIGILATALSPNMGCFVAVYSLISGFGATPLIGSPRDLMGRIYTAKAEKLSLLALIVSSTLGGLTGSLLGGWIASNFGWRWSFVPELLLIPAIVRLVQTVPIRPPVQTAPIDWIGGLLSFLGFGLTLLGVSLAGEYGWWSPKESFKILDVVIPPFSLSIVPTLIAAGLICLGLFAFWQRRQARAGKASLLRVGLLGHKPFLLGVFTATLHTLIVTGIQFNLYQFIPTVLGLNSFRTALTVIPFSLAMVVMAIYTTLRLVGRWPPKSIIYTGLTVFCVGLWILYTRISLTMTPLSLLPALVIMGAGSGLFLSQIGMLTFSTVHREQIAEANGIYTPFQNLGSALGRAIFGTVLIATVSAQIVDRAIAEFGQTVSPTERDKAIATIERVIQTFTRQERQEFFSQLPAAIQPSLEPILNTSAVEAMRVEVLLALAFSIVCLLSAVFLPKRSLNNNRDYEPNRADFH